MKKLSFFIVLLLSTSFVLGQTKADDLNQKVNAFWGEIEANISTSFGAPTGASILSVNYRKYGIQRISFLDLKSLGVSYKLTPHFNAGLGWNSDSKFPTLTLGAESKKFRLYPNWGLNDASLRVSTVHSATPNTIVRRGYWGGALVQLPVQTNWNWLNKIFKKAEKRLVLSTYVTQAGRNTRVGAGAGFEISFGAKKATESVKDFGLNVPTLPKIPSVSKKKVEKPMPEAPIVEQEVVVPPTKSLIQDRFEDLVVLAIVKDGDAIFVAETASSDMLGENVITSVEKYGERTAKVVTDAATCSFIFLANSEEVILTLGDDVYHVIFKSENGLFVGNAIDKPGYRIMVAMEEE